MTRARGWLVLLALAVAAGPAAASSADQFLVVPGRSMGPVVIGMRLDAVERILGAPTTSDTSSATYWYEWKAPEDHLRSIAVETSQNVVILISLAHDPRYRTSAGLGDGTMMGDVERALGRPSSVMRLGGYSIVQYRRDGIGFVTNGTGLVTGIVIAPVVN
jgi:hypothetical protein